MMVIAIMGLIMTISLANYRTGQRINELMTETQKIASVFKQAQSMALTGYTVSGGKRTDCGYGVYIENIESGGKMYKLFIDNSPCNYRWDSNEEIQTFSTAPNINMSSDCGNLVFEPPAGKVYCNGTVLEESTSFTITQTVLNRTLCIQINNQGRIGVSPCRP